MTVPSLAWISLATADVTPATATASGGGASAGVREP